MQLKSKVVFLLYCFVLGCGEEPRFNYNQSSIRPSPEELVNKALTVYAQVSGQCKEQKLALINDNLDRVNKIVSQLKEVVFKSEENPAPKSQELHTLFQLVTSENFYKAIQQSSNLIKEIANNSTVMKNLAILHEELGLEPGDRIAELITLLTQDTNTRKAVFGALKIATCSQNAPAETLLDALKLPSVIFEMGPNAAYLMGTSFYKHIELILKELKNLRLPTELQDLVNFVQEMSPKPNLCSIPNLDEYQKHFELITSLFEPQDKRPLKIFVNMLFQLYTMEESNGCMGTSFDDLKQENIQNALLMASDFLSSERGVVGFLQKIKSRR